MTCATPASRRPRTLRWSAAAGVAVLGLTAAGCAAEPDQAGSAAGTTYLEGVLSRPSQTSHNPLQPDIDFVTGLLQNHRDAVRASDDLLRAEPADAQVKETAQHIKDDQSGRASRLEAMLRDWHAPVPEEDSLHDAVQARASSTLSIEQAAAAEATESTQRLRDHRLTSGDWHAMQTAQGDQLANVYLVLMHRLHDGAVTLATGEQTRGTDDRAKQVAQEIQDVHRPEMERMVQLLRSRGVFGADVPRSSVYSGFTGPIKLKGVGGDGGRVDYTPTPVASYYGLPMPSPRPSSSSATPSPTPSPADTARPAVPSPSPSPAGTTTGAARGSSTSPSTAGTVSGRPSVPGAPATSSNGTPSGAATSGGATARPGGAGTVSASPSAAPRG